MTPSALEAYLHENLPQTEAMGVRVVSAGVDGVTLEAPFEPNRNHRGTLFGGSLASVAIAAGWSVVMLGLRQESLHARTVIQRAQIEYFAPGKDFFQAVAAAPDPVAWQVFCRTFARRGRARLNLSVNVTAGGIRIAALTAAFVALTGDDATLEGRDGS